MLEKSFDGSRNLQARKINDVIEYHPEWDADLTKRNSALSLYSFENPKSNDKIYIEISLPKSKEETQHTGYHNKNR